MGAPVQLDFSRAQMLPQQQGSGVALDFSKAQPIQAAPPRPAPPAPDFSNPTNQGVYSMTGPLGRQGVPYSKVVGAMANGYRFAGPEAARYQKDAAADPNPAPAFSAYTPTAMDRMRGVIANSAIGHSLESELPTVADALHLHPSETVYSPTYQSDKQQILAPQYLMPAMPAGTSPTLRHIASVERGILTGTGQLTSGKNLAIGAGIAATGGLAAPLAEGAGTVATLARVGGLGAKLGMFGMGAKGVYDDASHAYDQFNAGDTDGALESAGAALPNALLTLPALGEPFKKLGKVGQDAGPTIIDRTVGAKKGDYARGASPGTGYFQAGFGPSASMRSIAGKSDNALGLTGAAIGDTSASHEAAGGLIPFREGLAPIQQAISNGRLSLEGAGGTGDTSALDNFAATWNPLIDAARQRGGFLPTEYAAAKLRTAKNTTWGDPTQVGMKSIRQQTVGGMGGAMTDEMPALAPLNSRYQNLLKLSDRASERANTGSMPLTTIAQKGLFGLIGAGAGTASHSAFLPLLTGGAGLAIDSIPAKTALASALYYGGKGLSRFGDALTRLPTGVGNVEESPNYVEGGSRSYNAGTNQNSFNHSLRPMSLSSPDGLPNVTPEIIPPPASGGYSFRNLPSEVIDPSAQSRSRFGVGPNGRDGVLIRPLGALPAPLPVPPQATPYTFGSSQSSPLTAIPARSPNALLPSIGTAAHTLPRSVLDSIVQAGSPDAQAAAFRQANLGSYGGLVPQRLLQRVPETLLQNRTVEQGDPSRGVQPVQLPTRQSADDLFAESHARNALAAFRAEGGKLTDPNFVAAANDPNSRVGTVVGGKLVTGGLSPAALTLLTAIRDVASRGGGQ